MNFNTRPFEPLRRELVRGVPDRIVADALAENDWFTAEGIRRAADALASRLLPAEKLSDWLARYPAQMIPGKKIGIVMAGNIPFVGFLDLMCVLLLHGTPCVKPSSKDRVLMNWVIALLRESGQTILPLDERTEPDAMIATGSDRASRFFQEKYGALPAVFRGSRTSAAVLCRPLSEAEYDGLYDDAFLYFGLGCRNVTHLLATGEEHLDRLVKAFADRPPVENIHFGNSVRQRRAVLKMSGQPFRDGGWFLLRESDTPGAAVGELTYTLCSGDQEIREFLNARKDALQCVVGPGSIPFGRAQSPGPDDWPDGIDLLRFLQGL